MVRLVLAVLLTGCGTRVAPILDAGPLTEDSGSSDSGTSDAGPFDAGPEPTQALKPVPGELSIFQLRLPMGLIPKIGESAAVVGPDGTLVLIDVGNDRHADDVRAAVAALNAGVPGRSRLQVDWIVLTHFHADHTGAMKDLLDGADPLEVTRGIITRGRVDLGAGMNPDAYAELCALLTARPALDRPLCRAATLAGCDPALFTQPFPAVSCDGLLTGGAPTFLPLGSGARLTFIAADAHVSTGTSTSAMAAFGHDASNQENARSLVGLVSYGAFTYLFGGDLTGAGEPDVPDAESKVIEIAGPYFFGPLGIDVSHLQHHARRTSSNSTFVDASAPRDGRSRNATAGINGAYLGSPHAEVLSSWGDNSRLGQGAIWVTEVATGAASHSALINSNATVTIQTVQGGAGYRIQASGAPPSSRAFPSLRR